MLPFWGRSGPGSNGNEEVLRIPQISSITGTSPSDCLVSYLGHLLGEGSYPSAEKQSVNSTAKADWATLSLFFYKNVLATVLSSLPQDTHSTALANPRNEITTS